jgi:allantoin racemase
MSTSPPKSFDTRFRVAVISPVLRTDAIDVDATLRPLRSTTLEVENFFLDAGPASIENESDIAASVPGVLAVGARLRSAGWDALVVNCMCDPGLSELRASVAMPAFGTAETSMHAIVAAGGRFSVLDVVSDGQAMVEAQIAGYGVLSNYVSHRAIGRHVLELFSDLGRTHDALERAALEALADGADTVLLGCTGLAEVADELRRRLAARGVRHPVVEPLTTTLFVAKALLKAHVTATGRPSLLT